MIDKEKAPAQLRAFLSKRMGADVQISDFTPILGGYSRLMSRFTATVDGVPRPMVARADPPPGKAMMNTDSAQEWALLQALTRHGSVPMPDALYYDDKGSELGSRTIVLDVVRGRSLLAEIRGSDEAQIDGIVERFVDLCAQIHAVDLGAVPPAVPRPAGWDEYMDTRIQAWRDAEAALIDSNPFFRYMAAWLDDHRPEPAPLSLLHGELQASNVMVEADTGRLLAIDWELARIGDPREDLGWCKWVGTMQPPDLVARDEVRFAALYAERSGLGGDLVNPDTIAYFSILAGLNPVYGLATQIDSLTRGENSSITTAYLLAALSAAHEQWLSTALALTGKVGA